MTRTEDDRLSANRRKIEALKMENRRLRKRIAERTRKIDARRKIVAGSIVLKHADIDPDFAAVLHRLLDRFVLSRDRHLFDLPPGGDNGLDGPPPGGAGRPRPHRH